MANYRILREIDGHLLVLDSATSKRMGGIRQSGTSPELAVRKALSRLGLRYRVKNRDLPGSPDIANRARRWVIFVHGCYWHRHPGCKKATTPKRNRDFWLAKFDANVARDRQAVRELETRGYCVITIWECETTDPQSLDGRLRFLISR